MRSRTSTTPRRRTRSTLRAETLEPRTLLSGWSTVDTVPLDKSMALGITHDSAGNVYVTGRQPNPVTSYEDAVIREKAAGSSTWTNIETMATTAIQWFGPIVADANGDLFTSVKNSMLTNPSSGIWQIWERPAGQTAFSVVDQLPGSSQCNSLAVDAAGDVFAAGVYNTTYTVKRNTYSYSRWIVRKLAAGSSSFVPVDDHVDTTNGSAIALGIGVINSGTAAGIYAVGATTVSSGNSPWLVRKSTDGGATWTNVDTFQSSGSTAAFCISGDLSGNNVYVGGKGGKTVITGYNKNGTPIYGTYPDWVVRKSSTGNASSWSTDDDFQLAAINGGTGVAAIGSDLAGNMYATGFAMDSQNAGTGHSIIRSNAGGTWTTVDNFFPAGGSTTGFNGFTTDNNGNLYVSSGDGNPTHWMVRSQPAAPSNLTAVADAINPSLQIDLSWTNTAGADETGFGVYRSTDSVNFSLVGTVDANTTSYADTGLSAGSTYYYRVVTLLNSDGSSAPSNTASATTAGPVATPAAAAAVFSSVQVSATTDLTDLLRHRKHRRV